jgi:hypothetical protein
MNLKRLTLGLAVVVPLAVVGLAYAAGVFGDARQATARFHHLPAAEAAGYAEFRDAQGIACIELPGTGAMGVHYVKGSLVGDDVLDPSQPEALVYERRGQNMHLVALEYIVFKDVWEEEHSGRPSLFGREFDLVDSPNRYGLPAFYALHAWAWKVNPEGDFFAWNPRVDC